MDKKIYMQQSDQKSLIIAAYQAFEPNTIRQIIQLSFVLMSTVLCVASVAYLLQGNQNRRFQNPLNSTYIPLKAFLPTK